MPADWPCCRRSSAVTSVLVEQLRETIVGDARSMFVELVVVALVVPGQLVERLVVVFPARLVLVQEGRHDRLARQLGVIRADRRVHGLAFVVAVAAVAIAV